MEQQTTPAAADIEKTLIWTKAQLAADKFQFIGLRAFQTFRGISKVCAGIDQRRAEPRPIEIGGQIVVVGNRRAISCHRVLSSVSDAPRQTGRRMPQGAEDAIAETSRVLQQILNGREDGEQVALDVEISFDEGLTQCSLRRVFQQGAPCGVRLND